MLTVPAPSARLFLPRMLLLKAAHHHEGMYKHSGKYYLLSGKWHKLGASDVAPKGAPVSAHPKSAGHHEPAKHFTDEQWAALKLPDSNVNAPSFNKALDKLKEWSDAGDVSAIVGAGYGTNTYGQKLAKVANHLLGLHGSAHKVEAGQKAGDHAAVQSAEPPAAHPTGLPEHLAPPHASIAQAATKTGAKDEALQAAVDHLKEDAADPAMPPGEAAEDKALVQKLEAAQGASLVMPEFEEGKKTTGPKAYYESVAKKVIGFANAGDAAGLKGMVIQGVGSWSGKTPNSKKLLALHAAALAAVGASPAADTGPKEGDTKPGANGETLVFKDGHWVKQGGDGPATALKQQIDDLIATGEAGHVTQLYGPGSEAKQSVKDYVASKLSGHLSAQQLKNLQSIPWHKLKLPAENTNAKSHNAAIAKIEAMAFAGDAAGLQSFIDSKAGAKQTYAKKQALTAQTALAGLQSPDATAAVPVEPAPAFKAPAPAADDKITELTPAQIKGLHGWMKAVKPDSKHPDGWSNLWKKLSQGLKAAVVAEMGDSDLHDAASALQKKGSATPAAPATPAKIKTHAPLYENTTAGHNKFWAVSTMGSVLKTSYGKIGTKGQETTKVFPSEKAAKDAAFKLMSEKKAKGYVYKGHVEHEHDAPKTAADTGGWEYNPSDPGMSGYPTLSLDDGMIVVGDDQAEYHTLESIGSGDGEPKLSADNLSNLLSQMAADGHAVPPLGALQMLDPGFKESRLPSPKHEDGDTKMGADGMLVFKNGHWHKVEQAKVKKLSMADISTAIQTISPGQPKFSTNTAGKMAAKAAVTGNASGMYDAHTYALSKGWPKTAHQGRCQGDGDR